MSEGDRLEEREQALWDLQDRHPDNGGYCGNCGMNVKVGDPDHRITPIVNGGRGVECWFRGDFKDRRPSDETVADAYGVDPSTIIPGVTVAEAAENLRQVGRSGLKITPDEPTPLMKAHLALIRYGRHENACPWSYPPIAHTVCSCGLAEAIRKSCTNIEAEH